MKANKKTPAKDIKSKEDNLENEIEDFKKSLEKE